MVVYDKGKVKMLPAIYLLTDHSNKGMRAYMMITWLSTFHSLTKSPSPNRSNKSLHGFAALLIFSSAFFLMGAFEGARGDERLAYYSDYFSFAGADDQGRVAFAIDTNRGQDGDDFQAEHFVVLHDKHLGWQDIRGSGSFPNPERVLEKVPDSRYFRFNGKPRSGMVIESSINSLALRIQPIDIHLSSNLKDRERWIGSASATLTWNGRALGGRVIYEFLHYDNWNRLTRTYWGFWKDFHGFYTVVGDGITGSSGDFYLTSQLADGDQQKQHAVDGYTILEGNTFRLKDAAIRVEKSSMALGFYRWPEQWSGSWPAPSATSGKEKGKITFRIHQIERKSFGNWVIGGFAMSVVEGEIRYHDRTLPIYGLGEFIK
jgi:hypothetical protein